MTCQPNPADEQPPRQTAVPTRAAFRDAMARLGASVSLVTTDGPFGPAGFTATAVCSVTDAPPTLLVCLNRQASVYAAMIGNGVLAVNLLAPGHRPLAALFGGRTPTDERFAAASWRRGHTAAPLLEGAAVSFDCRIANAVGAGTHTVLLCAVVGIECAAAAESLVYFDRAFHVLPAVAD
jgi:flavin reductase